MGKTRGFDELLKRLGNIEKQVEKNVEKLKKETIDVGYSTAVSKAPVDTGELKGSIKKTSSGLEVGAEHGAPVEYGTFKSPAQPYFRPAYEDMKEHIEKNIGGVVDDT